MTYYEEIGYDQAAVGPIGEAERIAGLALSVRLTAPLEWEVGAVDRTILALNDHFVMYPSNRQLAKHVVFTLDKMPEEMDQEVLTRIESRG